jgi:hypothetical protein
MTPLTALWLPILVSAVGVFVASSLIHMVSAWHRSDYVAPPDQDRVLDAMRPLALPPGDYFLPRPTTREEMRSPAFDEKLKRGPVVIMTIAPNAPFSMGQMMGLWFVYLVVVAAFAGFSAGYLLPPGSNPAKIRVLSGVTAFAGYALALWQMSIWYKRSWGTTFRATVDGVLFAAITAFAFGWLWPK